MSSEETEKILGSIEMAFGVWGAVGPSNHVLDGGPHCPMVRGNFGGISSPVKSIGIVCTRVFIVRRIIRVVALWRKTQKLFGELDIGFAINRLRVRFPVGATLCNDCGQVDFFGDDAAFYRITSISCLV